MDGRAAGALVTQQRRRKLVFSPSVKQETGTPHAKGLPNNKSTDLKLDKLRVEKGWLLGSAEQSLLGAGGRDPAREISKRIPTKTQLQGKKNPHYHPAQGNRLCCTDIPGGTKPRQQCRVLSPRSITHPTHQARSQRNSPLVGHFAAVVLLQSQQGEFFENINNFDFQLATSS